ncbi:ATP-dependent RecD-like DNA helicase [Candidatus Dependentiae bacterium]|nr:ATP-dependent RecD-like DNA helicase [Candidatus Dependentiae bacterium]
MQQEELTGTIDRLLYQNQENGYTVLVLQSRGTSTVTVCGYLPSIQAGQHVTLRGAWVMHSKFGKQFEAKQCTATLPNSILGLKKYLGSGLIKGIGPIYAEKLVDRFGTDVLDVIENDPAQLLRVDGIGPKRVEVITKAWKDQKEIAAIMVFLQDKGISSTYATKIYKAYGQRSIEFMQENPYRLADEIWGVGFKTADAIAQKMGFDTHSLKRIRAGLLFGISSALNGGHLYITLPELKTKVIELLELNAADTEQLLRNALHDLYNSEKIKLITYQDEHFVTLTQYYFSERGVAQKLTLLRERPSLPCFDLKKIYDDLRIVHDERDIVLNDDQIDGVMSCLQQKITVITGGPGTGKTTLIKKLLQILDAHHISYKLAAPTGRAAKRIIEGTGRHALTIHRLLEFDPSTMSFTHNESNALRLQYLIIDEASMIDIFLAHAILKAVPHDAHLVFIGDVDQLPAVGAGNFLHDIIDSHTIGCKQLKQIFRQAQNSMIIVNAHRVNGGEFPVNALPGADKDFYFIKEENPENMTAHLEEIYRRLLPRFGIPADQSIALVPMNRGVVGTVKINHDLQHMLNQNSSEHNLTYAGTVYKVGDRVMQLRNNYDKNVFNGDIGVIEQVDPEEKVLTIVFNDSSVVYEYSELDEISLAYAISIHKSQGSEFSAAIIPIFMQHFTLLQRNLLYTAITRAKKLCILIGQPKAIGMAINNNRGLKRTTFLKEFLTTDLQCR